MDLMLMHIAKSKFLGQVPRHFAPAVVTFIWFVPMHLGVLTI